jgi:hypothetical protein
MFDVIMWWGGCSRLPQWSLLGVEVMVNLYFSFSQTYTFFV